MTELRQTLKHTVHNASCRVSSKKLTEFLQMLNNIERVYAICLCLTRTMHCYVIVIKKIKP